MSRVVCIFGDTGTCKTTLALSFPKPLVHFEFDIGGFDRAASRFKADVDSGLIVSNPYYLPMQGVDYMLRLTKNNKVTGMEELWYEQLGDYAKAIKDESIRTIVLDTWTQLYEVDYLSVIQDIQKSKPGRQKLQKMEYSEPFARLRGMVYVAERMNKNLVLICTQEPVWKQRVVNGEVEDYVDGVKPKGWEDTGKESDYVLRTYVETKREKVEKGKEVVKHIPHAVVTKSAVGLDLVDCDFENPTWDEIESLIQAMKES